MSISIAANVAKYIHIVFILGSFGMILAARCGLPIERRKDAELIIPLLRGATGLILLGFIAGLITYVLRIKLAQSTGVPLETSFHHVIGTKLLLLVATGACLGVGLSRARKTSGAAAAGFALAALILLATAAFFGVVV